jgi:hypothetical protein
MIATILGISSGTWIYIKAYRSSGGENKSAIMIGGISGALIFLLALIVLGMIFSK